MFPILKPCGASRLLDSSMSICWICWLSVQELRGSKQQPTNNSPPPALAATARFGRHHPMPTSSHCLGYFWIPFCFRLLLLYCIFNSNCISPFPSSVLTASPTSHSALYGATLFLVYWSCHVPLSALHLPARYRSSKLLSLCIRFSQPLVTAADRACGTISFWLSIRTPFATRPLTSNIYLSASPL